MDIIPDHDINVVHGFSPETISLYTCIVKRNINEISVGDFLTVIFCRYYLFLQQKTIICNF